MAGFRSVIDPSWLSLFSAPELQKLISGTNERIDIDDLKKYVEYIGGYHSGHRVCNSLLAFNAHYSLNSSDD